MAKLEKKMIETWEKEYKLSINYVKKTDTLYVRTTIGCWKIFLKKEIDQYLLYHKNTYNNQMPFDQGNAGRLSSPERCKTYIVIT